MGDQIQFNTERIAEHGREIETVVRPPLAKARETLNAGGTVEGGDFGITGTAAGMAYPAALQFAFEDLGTHLEMLDGFAKGIVQTARTYLAAEQAGTIEKV